MSLINQMLKDLEARHEGDARARLHREVRALPATSGAGKGRWVLAGGAIGLVLAAGLSGWWWLSQEEAAPAVAVAPVVPASPPAAAAVVETRPEAAPLPTTLEPPALAYVTERDSGLKLSSAIDQLPVSPPPSLATQEPEATPTGTAARKPGPVPQKQPDALPAEKRNPTTGAAPAAAPIASGGVEKKPVIGSRERSEAEYRRAITLVNDGRVSEGIDVLLETLRQDGNHLAARQLLVKLLIEQRRRDEASALLIEGLATHPGQTGWAMTLARLQVDRGDLPAASNTLQRSLPHGGGALADYLGFCGLVQYRLGHHAESATHYQNAARLAPQDGRWWLGLGLALEGEGQSTASREAFARARATGSLTGELATLVDQKLR